MFGRKSKLLISSESPSCNTCIYSKLNEEYELICKGKKEVESQHKCRRYKLDITKVANQRSHAPAKKQFDENLFKL